ncbi:MAG: GtrA family protein [Patescibacteria group bacterium]|nr:GtrA family protein [Patescibacteria group bacterium]
MIKKIDKRFIKFLFVGGLNTLFGYGLFAFFIFLHFNYLVAITFGTIIAIIFNFKTTGLIVFKSNDNKLIFKFFGVYLIVYILNVIGLRIFNQFNVSNYIAGAVLLLPIAIISFLLMRSFVFKTQSL